jgi:enoyl-CoA hydratase/carnithine racemase
MNYETIQYQVSERIAVITLSRPERLNAWIPEMGDELVDAMERACRDKEVRVIVLTGDGKGFCAGMDVKNLSKMDENRNRNRKTELSSDIPIASDREDFKGLFNYFPSIGKPVIAAINGPAAGSGLVLALSCDVRIAR